MTLQHTVFVAVFAASVLSFMFSCYQRLQLVGMGAPDNRFDDPVGRIFGMLNYAFAQKRVVARPYGLNHFLLFWAFLLLLLANGEFLVEGLFPGINLSLLPAPLYHLLGLVFDIFSAVSLGCVLVAFARRLLFPPEYLGNDYTKPASFEALLILSLIGTLMIAFFLLTGARIAMGEPDSWRPVSSAVAGLLQLLPAAALPAVQSGAWWLHALVLLAFMNFLPRSKHMHILTAIPNCYFRTENPNLLKRETFAKGQSYGVKSVEQYSWKDLLDSMTCAECGRCQDVCPAHNTGKPLNPRRVVHDIKVNLTKNGAALKGGTAQTLPLIGTAADGTIAEEALWSCTTCGACTSVCPVLIEQTPKIIKLRRHLVQEKAQFPEELLNLFENMEQRSNPWGIAPSERTKWSSYLGERTFNPGETEYLFFVGCAGAFDSRNKHVSVAVATILDQAGVSWGMLGKEELCCGDSVRRLGNEYVFEKMAKENVALFKERKITKVIATCPHCFNTIKNDYKQYGLEIEVLHHSQLIAQLVASGKLKLPHEKAKSNIVFHDSCYLGRHNDTYQAPRDVLKAATGKAPCEFERNHDKGFCCGAGGGRMWMEEQSGSRINMERVKEAMKQQPDTIGVSCPYCMTMMEDGLKDLGMADQVRVKDIAEVMAEGMAKATC
jgi:Fe-S oxidoreductase